MIFCSCLKLTFFKKEFNCSLDKKNFVQFEKFYFREKAKNFLKKAQICLEQEKFEPSILFFERFLRKSKKKGMQLKEVKKWEKKLAEISFYKTNNYEKALKYYTEILKSPLEPEEKFLFQKNLAKSFFYLKKYDQALQEAEKTFFSGISIKKTEEVNLLKARIFIAKKEPDKALDFFKRQIKKYPKERLFREYLALIYESQNKFLLAIKELERIEPMTAFIKNKIQKLIERQKNQPGFL